MLEQELSAYLARIRLDHAPAGTPEGVATLLAAHRQAIPFENLDVMLGRDIRIDGPGAFAKLVTARRGGYCFEQNRVMADVLAATGIAVRPLLARVRLGLAPGQTPARTHVLLLADLAGTPWLVDAGFGGAFVPPLPLEDGAIRCSPDGARHRLSRRDGADPLAGEWLLERAGPPGATDGRAAPDFEWQPQYSFDLAPVAPDDLEQANHWTATRPGTRFTTLHVVSRVLPTGFASLADRRLSVFTAEEGARTREIADPADYSATLRDVFALDLSGEDLARLTLF